MPDNLLTSTDQEEALSRVYVAAVAAGAGYLTSQPQPDRDGVDMQVCAGGAMRPCLDIQLKATINLGLPASGAFRFPLKRRNYDLLRAPTMVPRILVVLQLPSDQSEWLSIGPESLILRRCAYWASLAGQAETENTASVTVAIPDEQRFDVRSLVGLMERARMGPIV
jgi:hypothetical protein